MCLTRTPECVLGYFRRIFYLTSVTTPPTPPPPPLRRSRPAPISQPAAEVGRLTAAARIAAALLVGGVLLAQLQRRQAERPARPQHRPPRRHRLASPRTRPAQSTSVTRSATAVVSVECAATSKRTAGTTGISLQLDGTEFLHRGSGGRMLPPFTTSSSSMAAIGSMTPTIR